MRQCSVRAANAWEKRGVCCCSYATIGGAADLHSAKCLQQRRGPQLTPNLCQSCCTPTPHMYQAYRRKITLQEIAEIYVYIEIDRLSTFDGFGYLVRKKKYVRMTLWFYLKTNSITVLLRRLLIKKIHFKLFFILHMNFFKYNLLMCLKSRLFLCSTKGVHSLASGWGCQKKVFITLHHNLRPETNLNVIKGQCD